MKSAVETLSPTRAKMTVEVPAEDLKPSFDAAYKAIAKQVNIPGFRKGKVPPAVIDRQVGRGAVVDQAINEALPNLYVQALQDNDLLPIGQPEIEVTKLDEDGALEFTATVDVRPEIKVPAHDAMTVEVANAEVTEADVDEQLEHLRGRFATFKEVDRAAAADDDLLIDLLASQDGETVEGGEASNQSYVVGAGFGLDGLDEAVTGLKAGEEADFTSELAGGAMAGESVDIHVKVNACVSANCLRSMTSLLSWPPSSTPLPSCVPTSRPGWLAASVWSRPLKPVTPYSSSCLTKSRFRCLKSW